MDREQRQIASIERARLAKQILDNDLWSQVFEELDAQIVTRWRSAREPEKREQCHLAQVMLSQIRHVLETAIRDGKVDAGRLERDQAVGGGA